jgi:hypothetical protein
VATVAAGNGVPDTGENVIVTANAGLAAPTITPLITVAAASRPPI